jgi:hypothetical protein
VTALVLGPDDWGDRDTLLGFKLALRLELDIRQGGQGASTGEMYFRNSPFFYTSPQSYVFGHLAENSGLNPNYLGTFAGFGTFGNTLPINFDNLNMAE